MNLQLIRKTVGSAALLCASIAFSNQALAITTTVVVAKSGGNYTTITAALKAISPTISNQYVVEVRPGVYIETSTVNLKSYVHLKGLGRDLVTVKTALGDTAAVISSVGNVGVTISGLAVVDGYYGILADSTSTAPSSVTISDNLISGNKQGIRSGGEATGLLRSARITGNRVIGNKGIGIDVTRTAAVITGNTISGTGTTACYDPGSCMALLISSSGAGSDLTNEPTHTVTGNVIIGNYAAGIYMCKSTRAIISNNTVTDNALGGITFFYSNAGATVTNNRIVNNGPLYADIVAVNNTPLSEVRNPHISFNIFDTITGDHAVGAYNVNANGDPVWVP